MRRDPHPTNQDLLLAADGELSPRHAARLRAHLDACWECRTRLGEFEKTLTEFTETFLAEEDPAPLEGGRVDLLKERVAQAGQLPVGESRRRPHVVVPALALLVIALGSPIGNEFRRRFAPIDYDTRATPRMALTPGAIRGVTRDEVCSGSAAGEAQAVPDTLKRRVFEEYGTPIAKADMFEVDYLVTPELGGSQDIRNLWPQPYVSTVWNAHVKDELEERLHAMVCAGALDLATAQRELSKDWISAYKKYFHTEKPY